MTKISKMWENYNTKRTAKKHGRSFEQQEYRDKLAKRLKDWRKEWKSKEELAEILWKEQWTVEYAKMMINCWRDLGDDLANKLIDSWYWKRVKQNLSKFKQLNEKTINRIETFEEIEKERERKRQQEIKELESHLSPDRKVIWEIKKIGWKPCYIVKNQNLYNVINVMRWDKALFTWWIQEIIWGIREIGWKPCFEFKRNINEFGWNMIREKRSKMTGRNAVCRWERIFGYFDEISYIKDDWWVPIFKAKTYGYEHRLYGDECTNLYWTYKNMWTYLVSWKKGIISRIEKTRHRDPRTGELSVREKTN